MTDAKPKKAATPLKPEPKPVMKPTPTPTSKPTPKPTPSHPMTRVRPWCRKCILLDGLLCGQTQCPSYRKPERKEDKPKRP